MKYIYKVYDGVYKSIISGQKTIEFRLLNNKSENIISEDIIEFVVVDNEDKKISVKVINKYIYNNIDELWNDKVHTTSNVLNSSKEEFLKTLYKIFGEPEVKSSKIVGIEFELL